MAITIPGIPDSITRADYLRLIESVGLDPMRLRSLEFRMDGIYAEVKASRPGKDENPVDLIDEGRMEVATHRVYIRVDG